MLSPATKSFRHSNSRVRGTDSYNMKEIITLRGQYINTDDSMLIIIYKDSILSTIEDNHCFLCVTYIRAAIAALEHSYFEN